MRRSIATLLMELHQQNLIHGESVCYLAGIGWILRDSRSSVTLDTFEEVRGYLKGKRQAEAR